MARFKVGDRVRVNITIGSIYDKAGIITGRAQMQYNVPGQCYTAPIWKVRLDCGESISIKEAYLGPDRSGESKA